MGISASQVKELRERTGAGMMECKKALQETNGDLEAAIEHMRKAGMAKADKKAGRVAAEGRIVIRKNDGGSKAVIVEVNCETDFVAGGDDFISFSDQVADAILAGAPADMAAVEGLKLAGGETVDEARRALIAKIGENITVRRFEVVDAGDGIVADYLHGLKIGVAVALKGGDEALGRDLAMHVAASNPMCVSRDNVPAETIEHEKEILTAQARDSGKPEEIIEKMIGGRLNKWLAEVTLLGQPFVKDPDTKVEKLLKDAGAEVKGFVRFEVGEGIEKQEDNFAEEVMAQVKGS
ncbi:translation elongation factor Ts [Natronospira bacteriovora]|uniref:Elongation factor Ts n=1 Tax=Natronospira bacteriovora TaxID=3069753 RepID=A0ABU0W2V7_9GAMM|nr:translation elongation factor Ts [Natronospira sp. AB-CW4]MDQ2068344.1 translation elongation factor Ts [Natronospira sp. AB-CW4]